MNFSTNKNKLQSENRSNRKRPSGAARRRSRKMLANQFSIKEDKLKNIHFQAAPPTTLGSSRRPVKLPGNGIKHAKNVVKKGYTFEEPKIVVNVPNMYAKTKLTENGCVLNPMSVEHLYKSEGSLPHSKEPVTRIVKVAVVPCKFPDVQWSLKELIAIKEAILDEMCNNRTTINPNLLGCTYRSGWLLIYCNDSISRSWLNLILPKLKLPIKGNPVVVQEKDLDCPKNLIGHFPAVGKTSNVDILKLIKGQNDLKTENWVVVNRVENGATIMMEFSVDVVSAIILNRNKYQLYYAFGKVILSLK